MNWKNFKIFGKSKKEENGDSEKYDFEKIKVFKNLPKDQWKTAYKELNQIIAENLEEFGFKKKGRKHYRLTNDLLEVIDVDNRGSWLGATNSIEIRIGLVPYCWEGLINEYHLVGSKRIDEIDKSIRKHFRISQEYKLLADYLSKRIISKILPFFDKYNSTDKILREPSIFPYFTKNGGIEIYNSQFLILFSELKQHKISKAIKILENEIEFVRRVENIETEEKLIGLLKLIKTDNWNEIDNILEENEKNNLKKLRIKPVANNVQN
ncbi:protein of unknown function [Lutibacter oricola]|uniref:DUF4304 domain-containing protein n=1 Tax=Lutibacter oricola TaxID=762486 RepID=A0A1H3GTE2_9FLAO|nr:DUF4304 domain-containing protein [Lutibacter oricola]SDY06593.1 protein of unknown function [Lutibacter oricola]